jgi:hypothetical protein
MTSSNFLDLSFITTLFFLHFQQLCFDTCKLDVLEVRNPLLRFVDVFRAHILGLLKNLGFLVSFLGGLLFNS